MELCTASYAGPYVLQKAQQNFAVLFRTRLTMLCRSEIRIGLLIDADSLNWRQRCFCLHPTICHIYQGVSWPYHGYCTCVQDKDIAVKNPVP